jgi:Flp pilus assembly pilin Flp
MSFSLIIAVVAVLVVAYVLMLLAEIKCEYDADSLHEQHTSNLAM